MPKGWRSIGATSGNVSAAATATGHHSAGEPAAGCATGASVATSTAWYPALSIACSNAAAGTAAATRTVALPVARLTAAEATPGTLHSAFSTRDTHAAQVMPSTCRARSRPFATPADPDDADGGVGVDADRNAGTGADGDGGMASDWVAFDGISFIC